MTYTRFDSLTDNELILAVANQNEATDLEVALTERLIYWMEYARTIEEDLDETYAFSRREAVRARYREVA